MPRNDPFPLKSGLFLVYSTIAEIRSKFDHFGPQQGKRITKNQSGALERSGSERRCRSPVRKTDLQKPWRSLRAQWQPTQKGSLKTQAAPQSAAAASEGVAAPCAKRITKNQSGALERSGSERRRRSPVRKTDLQKPWWSLRAKWQ